MFPVFAAMDTTDLGQAEDWCRQLHGQIAGIKLGLEFFCTFGQEGIKRLASHGLPIFLDLKLHDIPNTVAKTVRTLRRLPVQWLTIHTSGGQMMLDAAQQEAGDDLSLLGVTVLTSLEQKDILSLGLQASTVEEQVLRLARLAHTANIRGLVCSPLELAALRLHYGKTFTLVTPGIRLANAQSDDQQRTATPRQAVAAGADYLVMGRSLLHESDPAARLQKIFSADS
jgi:orotidine-5'-phosphate decarboxylase